MNTNTNNTFSACMHNVQCTNEAFCTTCNAKVNCDCQLCVNSVILPLQPGAYLPNRYKWIEFTCYKCYHTITNIMKSL